MLCRYVSGEERCIACKLYEESRNDHQDGGHSRLDEGSAQVGIKITLTVFEAGTSASSPMAAGIIALVLEAAPSLTWRDVQHIIVRTAKRANLKGDDWRGNGAGYNVSHAFGFGLMDAGKMVRLAREWQTVGEQHQCEAEWAGQEAGPGGREVSLAGRDDTELSLELKDCDQVNIF